MGGADLASSLAVDCRTPDPLWAQVPQSAWPKLGAVQLWSVDELSGGAGKLRANFYLTCENIPIMTLNDTGLSDCVSDDLFSRQNCPVPGLPGQDGDYGRDALASSGLLQKKGGGAAGFDFTKLDSQGQELNGSAASWSCVRDNVTGLVWETKQEWDGGEVSSVANVSWYNPDPATNGGVAGTPNVGTSCFSLCDTSRYVQYFNQQRICGSSNWRVPTKTELRTIVNLGRAQPAVDVSYFPLMNTNVGNRYWTSTTTAQSADSAWAIDFAAAVDQIWLKSQKARVVLVHDEQ